MVLMGSVARIDVDGFEGLRLSSGEGGLEATFVPSAGMVGASLRDGDAELLGQRSGLRAYAREGATMGIPLLYPWANRLGAERFPVAGQVVDLAASPALVHRDENGLPIHGLLAGWAGWRVEDRDPGEDRRDSAVAAIADLAAAPEVMAAFPFPHRLRLEARLRGPTLTVRTALTATGERPVPVAFGFHPYLQLPDAPRETWRVQLPAMRRLETDPRGIPTGASKPAEPASGPLGSTSFDDGFAGVEAGARFAVSGAGRRLVVAFDEGYPVAQIYAPPTDAVICFEPMTAPTDALRSGDRLPFVEPGRSYVATFSITVERDG
jgi:aldose 1-epimerase